MTSRSRNAHISAFQDLVPTPLAREGWVDSLELGERVDWTGGHETHLALLQVATLGQDDQVVLHRHRFPRPSFRRRIRPSDQHKAVRQKVALAEAQLADLSPERLDGHSSPSSSKTVPDTFSASRSG